MIELCFIVTYSIPDVNECTEVGCGTSVAGIICTEPALNERTCTCPAGYNGTATLTGETAFGGCVGSVLPISGPDMALPDDHLTRPGLTDLDSSHLTQSRSTRLKIIHFLMFIDRYQ